MNTKPVYHPDPEENFNSLWNNYIAKHNIISSEYACTAGEAFSAANLPNLVVINDHYGRLTIVDIELPLEPLAKGILLSAGQTEIIGFQTDDEFVFTGADAEALIKETVVDGYYIERLKKASKSIT